MKKCIPTLKQFITSKDFKAGKDFEFDKKMSASLRSSFAELGEEQ